MKEVAINDAYNKFKPDRPVFVISTNLEGKPSGMIANWHMRCSFDPPLYAVSLSKSGYTHKLIEESGEFVISVPNKSLEENLMFFGTNHGDKIDKFKQTNIKTFKGKFTKIPLLSEATINLECKVQNKADVGDHYIYIGEVLATYLNQDKKILLELEKLNGKRRFKEFEI